MALNVLKKVKKKAKNLSAFLVGLLVLAMIQRSSATEIRENLKPVFRRAELANNLPAGLLERVAQQESAFRSDIILGKKQSSAGAQGIMQIIPRWHPNVNPLNPIEAINYAGKFLRRLYDKFGRWDYALAAYNWGEGNLEKNLNMRFWNPVSHWPDETQRYVKQILNDVNVE